MPQPQMTENDNDATVTINGRIMSGYITPKEPCNTCGSTTAFSLGYWSPLCPNCNKWLKQCCGDPACLFCMYRPEVPLVA